MLPTLLLAACERYGQDSGADSAAPDTDDTAPVYDPLLGVEEVGRDTESLAELGLIDVTYAVTDAHLPLYRTNEGGDPRFHVLAAPGWFDDGAAHPLLIWLHGGVSGIEGDDENSGTFCTAAGVADLIDNALHNHDYIWARAAELGWMVMVPESTWCDLWAGLGPDDPFDTRHASAFHVLTALDALGAGLGGLGLDEAQVYAWGTSIGGSGVFPVAHGYGESPSRLAGIVTDSGPVITSFWYLSPAQTEILDHLMGGSPEAVPDNYARIDAALLIDQNDFRVPVFSAYNEFDELTGVQHGRQLAAVLDDVYASAGVRAFHHDYVHHSPGEQSHTQTQISEPPYAYTAEAALRFLQGGAVTMLEAEDLCAGCARIAETDADANPQAARMSGGIGVVRTEADGAGLLFEGRLPATVPRGVPLSVLFVLIADGTESARRGDPFVTLTVGDEPARAVTVGDLAVGSAPGAAADLAHVVATTLDGITLPEGDVEVEVLFHGVGNAYLDGFYVVE